MATAAAPSVAVRPGGGAWYALLLLTIVYSFSYADRYLIASLAAPIKAEFRLSDSFLGLLMGPAFALLFATSAVPIARAADRMRRVTILSAGCFVWSLFTLLSGFAANGTMLAIFRIGVGIGEAAFVAPAYSLLADRFPPDRRGFAFGILALGIYLGQVGGYAGGPGLAAALGGWRGAFIALGLAGMVLAVLLTLSVAEPKRTGLRTRGPNLLSVAGTLWRQPSFVLSNLGMAFGTFSGMSFGMWGPTLFARAFDTAPAVASARFGIAFAPAGLVGALLFGALCDRLVRRDSRWPLRLAGISLLAATLAILAVTYAPDIRTATLLAIPAGLLGGGWSVGVLTALQNLLPQTVRATATALFTLLTTLVGMVFGPFIVGALSDAIGTGEAASLRLALTSCIVVGLPAAAALWFAARGVETARIDLNRQFEKND